MEGVDGSYPASHCRDLISHSLLGRHSGSIATHQGPVYTEVSSPDAGRQCPAPQTSKHPSLAYGYSFGNSCYGCRWSHTHNLQQKPFSQPAKNYVQPNVNTVSTEELSTKAKEFAFYPGYASSYQAVPGYLDVPGVSSISTHSEPVHDALIPVEGYQHWTLSNGWDGQVYFSKEQTQSAHIWKAPFPDVNRRGCRKRVPYTKVQLKKLEEEFAASKFITKDKRRSICATTNLSERQVTIWFQNRRVKEKKLVNKSKDCTHVPKT